MIANEVLRKHYVLFAVRISAYFFILFSYLIFLFPVLFKQINTLMFVCAQITAISIVFVLLYLFLKVNPKEVYQSKKLLLVLMSFIILLMNTVYFLRLIPPVPLVLQHARMYHLVEKTSEGDYIVVGEESRLFPFIELPQHINLIEGDPLYIYASIYSPIDLNTSVVHKWEYYNEEIHAWETLTEITIPIIGGREQGYRTYSTKSFVPEGKWRVQVSLLNGQTIGRVDFSVAYATERPQLISKIK
jgi:hypothetical protein